MATAREQSRNNFEGHTNLDSINMGSFQRIADACELMAKNHLRLQDELKWMTDGRDRYMKRAEGLENKIRTLKGVITKLKKKHP